jgi:hypothetical protein
MCLAQHPKSLRLRLAQERQGWRLASGALLQLALRLVLLVLPILGPRRLNLVLLPGLRTLLHHPLLRHLLLILICWASLLAQR